MRWRGWLTVATFVVVAACDNPADTYPGQISTSFDGGKELVLVARYSVNAEAIGILSWADVAIGTPATIEMTGPLHMHCPGTFQKVPPEFNDPGNRPGLDVGDGVEDGANLHAPPGQYTVTVSVPSVKVSIKKSFSAGPSIPDAITGLWTLAGNCVQIADTQQQLRELVPAYVHAVVLWVSRLLNPAMRLRLTPLAAEAQAATLSGRASDAISDLTTIRSAVEADTNTTPEYETFRVANIALALLTQAVPAT